MGFLSASMARRRRRKSAAELNLSITNTQNVLMGHICLPILLQMAVLLLMLVMLMIQSAPGVDGRVPFSAMSSARMRLNLDATQIIPGADLSPLSARGGATVAAPQEDGDNDKDEETTAVENDIRQHPDYAMLQAYRMRQQGLLQLRATMLSEALVSRGLPLPSLKDTTTPEGKAPSIPADWECVRITKENKLSCMYTYEEAVGTKLVAPVDAKNATAVPNDNQWITIPALNRQRRKDVSKIDHMWHYKYSIVDSWFKADSEYSFLQHVGAKGILLNILLNDFVLALVVAASLYLTLVLFMPLWEALLVRFLVSGVLWWRWPSWGRFVHLGLPFKIMVGQQLAGLAMIGFNNIKGKIKDYLVEMECEILDKKLPLTLGVPTPLHVEEKDAEILEEEEEIMEHLVMEEDSNDDDDISEDESDYEE